MIQSLFFEPIVLLKKKSLPSFWTPNALHQLLSQFPDELETLQIDDRGAVDQKAIIICSFYSELSSAQKRLIHIRSFEKSLLFKLYACFESSGILKRMVGLNLFIQLLNQERSKEEVTELINKFEALNHKKLLEEPIAKLLLQTKPNYLIKTIETIIYLHDTNLLMIVLARLSESDHSALLLSAITELFSNHLLTGSFLKPLYYAVNPREFVNAIIILNKIHFLNHQDVLQSLDKLSKHKNPLLIAEIMYCLDFNDLATETYFNLFVKLPNIELLYEIINILSYYQLINESNLNLILKSKKLSEILEGFNSLETKLPSTYTQRFLNQLNSSENPRELIKAYLEIFSLNYMIREKILLRPFYEHKNPVSFVHAAKLMINHSFLNDRAGIILNHPEPEILCKVLIILEKANQLHLKYERFFMSCSSKTMQEIDLNCFSAESLIDYYETHHIKTLSLKLYPSFFKLEENSHNDNKVSRDYGISYA